MTSCPRRGNIAVVKQQRYASLVPAPCDNDIRHIIISIIIISLKFDLGLFLAGVS